MLKLALTASALASVCSAGQVMTSISFHGHGFPDGVFKAHLHAAPCSADGGGHYNGGDGVTVDAINENWPEVTCANGQCTGMAYNQWAPAASAVAAGLSLVVHDTPAASSGSGSKMLCADLTGSAGQYASNSFAYLSSYAGAGYGECNKDSASMEFAGTSTSIEFHCAGCLDATFKAHLHAAPCSADGGGHYNGGDGVTVDAINENWPEVTCANGRCSGMANSDWVPLVADLAAGLSIVVHDTPAASSGSGSKMLCADLARLGHGSFGSDYVNYLSSYAGAGYGEVHKGMASLMKPELATSASFKGSGFGDNMFNAHLHADTCANGGGGHYNGGDGVTVDAVNENWPTVSCSEGVCSGMAMNDWWIPAADRAILSIVIHDTPNNGGSGSGPKMMCADVGGKNGKGTFSYVEAFTGAGYGSFGKSSATLAYGMGMGKGKGGGGKGGGKRGSSHTKRGGKHASLENSNAAVINNTSIVGASVGAGLLVVAAALFAIKKRSARASPIAESETLLE